MESRHDTVDLAMKRVRELNGETVANGIDRRLSRDEFAAAALPQLSVLVAAVDGITGENIPWKPHHIAFRAYAIADAMLAERDKAEPK